MMGISSKKIPIKIFWRKGTKAEPSSPRYLGVDETKFILCRRKIHIHLAPFCGLRLIPGMSFKKSPASCRSIILRHGLTKIGNRPGSKKIEIRKNPAHVLRLKRIITQLEKISIENTKIFIEKIDKIVLRLSLCDTYSQ